MRKNRMRTFSLSSVPILVALAALWALGNADSRANPSNGSQSFSQTWRLTQPVTYENMTIFPIVAAQNADTGAFVTLDDALASGDVVITEQGSYLHRTRNGARQASYGSGPEVNQLVLVNRGKRPLILLAGEVVSGGKQDRIIGKDRIIPVGAAPLPLDVFCVEHGRWTGDSEKFSAAQLMVHPAVRKEAAVEQDQNKVWAAVRGETAPADTGSRRRSPRSVADATQETNLDARRSRFGDLLRIEKQLCQCACGGGNAKARNCPHPCSRRGIGRMESATVPTEP